jgi:putative endonuclease
MSGLSRSRDARQQTGASGEQEAAGFYEARGARILSRNFRCRLGEIDLVVEEAGTVVFVEVKSASKPSPIAPELRVGRDKQRRLTRLAEFYLSYKKLAGKPVRFDVVAVTADPAGGASKIVHFPAAFTAAR